MTLAFVRETNRGEGLDNFILWCLNPLVFENELEDRSRLFAPINIVLDIESPDFVRRRETFDLAINDGTHESRFSATIHSQETVTMTTFKTESRRIEKNFGTVGQRELTVAEIFTLFFVLIILSFFDPFGSGTYNPVAG